MSLATLKKKSKMVYGDRINSSTISSNGFSINGIKRVIGAVGDTNLNKSVTRTPFKGIEPVGHGGGRRCRVGGRFARTCSSGSYPVVISNSGSCSTNQELIKKSTKNTSGLIRSKYKWVFSTYPRYMVHKIDIVDKSSDYTEKIKNKSKNCTINSVDSSAPKTCCNRYHIGGKLYMNTISGNNNDNLAADESYDKHISKLKYQCLLLEPNPTGINRNLTVF